jgi:tRNA nucleotidyltransferase/poly(A) polymerase
MKNNFPDYVNKILDALCEAGYEAYVVGGAVRDLLLGLEPGDFDITTNAKPEQVLAVAKTKGLGTVEKLGQNFGVVVLVLAGKSVEVATFRGERYGTDAHRPEEVWYCNKLEDDLKRRDFTVNAMAMDRDGKLYDYAEGQADLQKRILRTVGDAKVRYQEDALRMYRACRFVAQLDFTYEGELPFNISNCRELSLERIRTELDKLLVSQAAGKGLRLFMESGLVNAWCRIRENGHSSYEPVLPEIAHLYQLPQNSKFHCYDAWEHTLHALDNGPRDLTIRWALLLHDVAKGLPGIRKPNKEGQPSDHGHEAVSAKIAFGILNRLHYPEAFVNRIVWLVAQHMRFAPLLIKKERTILHWVRGEALSGKFRSEAELTEGYTQLVAVFLADMQATWAGQRNPELMAQGRELGRLVIELAATKMPVKTSDLHVKGQEVMELSHGKTEVPVGKLLQYLVTRVQNGELANEHDALLEALKHKLAREEKTQA